MIKPEPGRVVHLYFSHEDSVPGGFDAHSLGPFAATVAYVHGDRMVNLSTFDHNGNQYPITSVKLLQDSDLPEGHSRWAEWMPFQKGQAVIADKLGVKPSGT